MFRLSLLKHKSGIYDKNTYTQLEYECKGRPYFTISSHYVCKKKKIDLIKVNYPAKPHKTKEKKLCCRKFRHKRQHPIFAKKKDVKIVAKYLILE